MTNFTILQKIPFLNVSKGLILSAFLMFGFANSQGQFVHLDDPDVAVGTLSPNLLTNPGFEDDFTSWGVFGAGFNTVIESLLPFEGNKHAKLFGQFNGGFNVSGFFQDVPATGGDLFLANVKMLTQVGDAIEVNGVDDNFIELHIEYRDANGDFVGAFVTPNFKSSEQFNGSTGAGSVAADYLDYPVIMEAPAGTAIARFVVLFFQPLWDGGAVYFDDCSLQKVLPQGDLTVTLCQGFADTQVDLPIGFAQDESGIASFGNNINGTDDASGIYAVGTHNITFDAVANDGGTASHGFTLNVAGNPNVPPVLSCNDQIQISLDGNGVGIVTADMLVEGLPAGCIGAYDVSITNAIGAPLSPPNVVGCANVGGTWIGTVTDPDSGNSCWSTIIVEDKLAPIVLCMDRTFPCTVEIDMIPPPTAIDNCALESIALVSLTLTDDDACDGDNAVQYVREYIATDIYGNTSDPCQETITIERPTNVDFPDDITWQCDQYALYPNIIDATPKHIVIVDTEPGGTDKDIDVDPTLSGIILSNTGSGIPAGIDGTYCQYGYNYSDEILGTCDLDASLSSPVFKIVRTWTVLDWCTSNVILYNDANGNQMQEADEEDNQQTIKVIDEVGPSIVAPVGVVLSASTASVHPHPCSSNELIPAPTVTDNCTPVVDLQIFTTIGEVVYLDPNNHFLGGYIPNPGLTIGTHTVTAQATDMCGNISEVTFDIEIVDNIAPAAICDLITDVNLSSDGMAVVNAETFDDGSHDNCCLDNFTVRKMTDFCTPPVTTFGPSVKFCCEDVSNSPITVVFRATDCYNNANDCMVVVNVSDKQDPVLVSCPTDATITCNDYFDNYEAQVALGNYSVLDGFGAPAYADNCGLNINYEVEVNVNQCSEGTIEREWNANDPSNNQAPTCTQIINIVHVSNWAVMFPDDVVYECDLGGVTPEFGEPVLYFEDCELLAVSYEDVLFDDVPDACYKLARTWVVINWCTVGDEIDQEVVELSECDSGIDYNGNNIVCAINNPLDDPSFLVGHGHRTFRENQGAPTETVGGPQTTQDGYITYQQVIKVKDSVQPVFTDCTIPDVCIYDGCSTTVVLPEPTATDCSSDIGYSVDYTDLPNGSGFGPYVNVAPGVYTVTYKASDNCGNWEVCESSITVNDCKNPTPYCVQGLIISIMNTNPPMVEIWASDFDAGSFDNCGVASLSFSANTSETSVLFDCNDVGEQLLQLWVTDIYGNQDFCEVVVQIQDNFGNCGTPLVVAGNVSNEIGEPVMDVDVNLSGAGNATFMTGADGNFTFPMVEEGGDYSVLAHKDVNPLNGVTTFDLVLMSKHILGTQALDSPYKIIAADVNRSNSVTTIDMVTARKVILNIAENFTNNTSWRFVDSNHVFTNPANPFNGGFPEILNFNNIPENNLEADFVAIKVGDVNLSSAGNELLASDDRNFNGKLTIKATDRMVAAGEQVQVDFTAKDFLASGFQFTLNFDQNALRFAEMAEGLLSEENFGLTLLEEGAITASWHQAQALELADDAVIFSLVFEAQTNTQLSNALNINSRYTLAEAYNVNDEIVEVELDFGTNVTSNDFELYQNRPNPFGKETVIGFNLPKATVATITVTDLSGKIIKVIEQDFSKGYNEINLSKETLQATGVLYYQLATDDFSATKMMVLF